VQSGIYTSLSNQNRQKMQRTTRTRRAVANLEGGEELLQRELALDCVYNGSGNNNNRRGIGTVSIIFGIMYFVALNLVKMFELFLLLILILSQFGLTVTKNMLVTLNNLVDVTIQHLLNKNCKA